jgi:AraC-like DNA-binding protein
MDQRQLEDYNKVIESLGIKYIKANNIKLAKSVTISNFHDPENTILVVKKGEVKYGEENTIVKAGEILFIPGGYPTNITYGYGSTTTLTNEELDGRHEEFFQTDITPSGLRSVGVDNFDYMTFEANIFDTVNFFKTLDIAPFSIKSEHIADIIADIISEDIGRREGRSRVISLKSDQLVIEIIRYIIDNRLFVEQLATNSTYFKDPRLLDLFQYVKENLGGDLSNKVLAEVTSVSEDYVGQYFKMLTGMNPQDYIEYQRMQLALELLRTTKKSIRTIGHEIGYKDTAYFCRRFKMMYGIPAGKMRRRETLMNIK